ncbi:MAG: hypothetical protein COT85_07600 [Chlamydiae bacterium CG10_big_fil_rev_8_21_14_0_10_42_34]|nr:MAG: hypothetical protein COT85_07600 [Chlamydiae bacterium CG10_big_fil_rev_8_21_14_0_10_42_34]
MSVLNLPKINSRKSSGLPDYLENSVLNQLTDLIKKIASELAQNRREQCDVLLEAYAFSLRKNAVAVTSRAAGVCEDQGEKLAEFTNQLIKDYRAHYKKIGCDSPLNRLRKDPLYPFFLFGCKDVDLQRVIKEKSVSVFELEDEIRLAAVELARHDDPPTISVKQKMDGLATFLEVFNAMNRGKKVLKSGVNIHISKSLTSEDWCNLALIAQRMKNHRLHRAIVEYSKSVEPARGCCCVVS